MFQLRYISYVMFLFNPKVTYLEYNLPSTAGRNNKSLGRWLCTRWYSTVGLALWLWRAAHSGFTVYEFYVVCFSDPFMKNEDRC